MILSDNDIRPRKIITPFSERTTHHGMTYGLGPAGYDVRIAQGLVLPPNGFALASTLEHFTMPNTVVGFVHDKSTWARMGLALQNTVIEPGWKGFLTLELTNHSDKNIIIESGSPIAQIVFHFMYSAPAKPYSGKYQNQGPEPHLPLFDP